jgi:hypothetical protein
VDVHHHEIKQLAESQHDVFTTADARRLGYDHRGIRRAVDRREWTRVRRGSYVLTPVWETSDPVARHLLRARAVIRPLAGEVALSHTTAMLALGVQAWGPRLADVHVTRLDGRQGGHEHGVAHHQSAVNESECVRLRDGHGIGDPDFLVVPPVHAVAGAMLLHGLDQAVVMADSALFRGLVAAEPLGDLVESWSRVPDSRHVRLAARLMDGRSESAGETLGRLVFWRGGLPRPELQVRVVGPAGQLAYTDFGWGEQRVVGEFDGKVKYLRSLREGESASDVLFREKQREEWIVETGLTVRRLVWSELFTPNLVVERFARALRIRTRTFV